MGLSAADLLDGCQRVPDRVEVDARVERPQPLLVDQRGGAEEVGGVAVEHHADVDELLAVDARDAAQRDVLVAVHATSPVPGSQARGPDTRASRWLT